ncbi:glycosyl hydrolase family 28 protein [Halomontanus rarus]|uniref:glycosyl hydrolase family 28 protein n=1 Tax=Halomontanus rarus TaxID=3034020 RepID=UPI001A99BBA8
MDDTTFDVTEYGGADATVATEAFQTAIDACGAAGGGTVRVPAGTYETGTVRLRDDVTLHLEAGATVAATEDESEYSAERVGPDGERVFLLAEEVENVALTGRGTFDGRGTAFMRMDTPIQGHSGESSAHPLITSGSHEARQGEDYLDREDGTDDWPVAKPDFRPGPMFEFDGCENVLVENVTMRDMPSWTIHVDRSTDVDVRGIDILGDKRIPNNDGIAVTDSRNVHISDCTLVTCDDSICMNGTAESDKPCENVTVTNCTIESNACAIKFGSQTAGVMRNFTFENCIIQHSNRGLGIQHRDSGTLENVLFSNIVIETRLLSGPWWGKAEPIYVTSVPRDEETELGTVRNVRFSNVLATAENGALVYGSEEATIENLSFDDVRLEIRGGEKAPLTGGNFDLQPTAAETPIVERDISGVHCEGVADLDLEDVTVEWGESLPEYFSHGIQCIDVDSLEIDGFDGRQAHLGSSDAAIALCETETVSIRDCRARPGTGRFLGLEGGDDRRLFVDNDLADADTVGIDGIDDGSGSGSESVTKSGSGSESESGFVVSGNVLPL